MESSFFTWRKNSHSFSSMFMLSALFALSFLSLVQAQNGTTEFDPFSEAARCPFPCNSDRSTWAAYHDLSELDVCKKTILLDLNVYFKVDGLESLFAMRGCAIEGSSNPAPKLKLARRQMLVPPSSSGNITKSTFDTKNQTADIEIVRYGGANAKAVAIADSASISTAAAAIGSHLKSEENGEPTTLFVRSGSAVIGVFAGAQIDMASVGLVVEQFAKRAVDNKADETAAQLCKEGFLSTQIFGIYLNTKGDLGAARDAVKSWRDAECISNKGGEKEVWQRAPIATVPGKEVAVGPETSDNTHNDKRATCSYTQAQAGDGCWALADRCKITQDQLKQYNGANICDNIKQGQYVCCNAGTLPDFSPQPNPDGSCKTTTFNGDFCATIAEKNKMTVAQIEERNKKTWAWGGCNFLQPGQVFCLSTGTPPMPPPLTNAVCGPQVPGTKKPANLDDLASLNECPLKACCNVWGQCGTTKDFCIKNPGDTGAPGTTQPGANSCSYNCGMDIINNKTPPAKFIKIGYFEAFNEKRPCLHMRPKQIDGNMYTHVHYAFGGISSSYDVDMSGQEQMFKEFKAVTGTKKIMSFGGWSFSTEGDTFPIFREGVTPAQRDTFAKNTVKFLTDNGLDGLDFDWEYPGAPDIPGIPPGGKNDGANYLAFLKLVKGYLPAGKSLSIAAPASFWYLKGFPIEEMSKVVDYIVYMTYDIHGQWDYGNKWTSEGCANGDCLRSHVNRTETENAMVMVTKAGVQANKVIIGMALYGRSFKMVDPGCRTPNCKFTGPESGAAPGRCTGTSGYVSNFEIREIISSQKGVTQYTDKEGDYVIYNGDNWVSYMRKTTYDSRVNWVKGLNFGGVVDWAMDLDADYGSGDGPGGGDSGSGPVLIDPAIYTTKNPTIMCYPQCTFVFPPMTLSAPTTIKIPPETVTYEENWVTTVTVSGAVITTSAASIATTVVTVPAITTSVINIWDITYSGSTISGSTFGTLSLTMSVSVPPATFTYTNKHDTTSSGGPPIFWTWSPGPWPPIPPRSTPPGATTTPIPPPPPPPTNFPSTITVKPGPPNPTCTANCGKPCQRNCDPGNSGCIGICGCIGPFCPKPPGCPLCPPGGGCIGPGCSDGGGGGGGGGGNPNDPSSCRTRTTVSTCEVECSVIKYPGTSTTTCEKPECSRTITACSTTGTTTTTTTTLSCETNPPYPSFNPKDKVPLIGDGGLGGNIVDAGDFKSMTKKPTTTKKPDPPPSSKPPSNEPALPTFAPGKGNPYCFRDHNDKGQYHKFGEAVGNPAMEAVCNTDNYLSPGNSFGYAVSAADNLIVSVTWAKDTTGCPAKKDVPIKKDQFCLDTMRMIILACDKGVASDTYGGAFVESNQDFGCVRWWIGTSQTSAAAARVFAIAAAEGTDGGNGTMPLNAEQQKIIMEELNRIEPELPVMVRPEEGLLNGTAPVIWRKK